MTDTSFTREEFCLRVIQADERGRNIFEYLREHNPALRGGG